MCFMSIRFFILNIRQLIVLYFNSYRVIFLLMLFGFLIILVLALKILATICSSPCPRQDYKFQHLHVLFEINIITKRMISSMYREVRSVTVFNNEAKAF